MIADGIYDLVCAVVLPVQTVHIPLDRSVAEGDCCLDEIVIVGAVGRTEQMHFIPGQLLHTVVDGQKLLFLFRGAEGGHILVMFAVIAKIVSVRQNRFDILRIGADPAASHEKGDLHIVFPEDGEDILGVFIAPGGIKGQRNLRFGGVDTVDGQLSVSYGVAGGVQGRAVIVYVTEDCDQADGQDKGFKRDVAGHKGSSDPF